MKSKGLRIAILTVPIIVLAGLLLAVVIYRATVQAIDKALTKRNQVGFVVDADGVVFRTPNSELLAPAWREPVTMADPSTFKTLFHSTEFCLGADSLNVFLGEGIRVYRLSNCKAPTFRLLTPDGRFTCDAQHVYFKGFQLPQADPTSIKILGQYTSKDATQVYVGPLLLEGADPDTFQIQHEGDIPNLQADYSQGPCSERKLGDNPVDVSSFRGQDKHNRFQGRSRYPRNSLPQ